MTKRKYTRCKVQGCKGKECSGRGFTLGFCSLHYSKYKNGIVDIDGNQIRVMRLGKRPFGKALMNTLRLVRSASKNAKEIRRHIDEGDKDLIRQVNCRLHDINAETAMQEGRLTEREFVFGNIDLLTPSALRAVVGEAPTKRVAKLSDKDKARIAWHLTRRKTPEQIAEVFGIYSIKQVRKVAELMREGKLPIPANRVNSRRI